MAIFRPKSDLIRTLVLVGAAGSLILVTFVAWAGKWSPYLTEEGEYKEQPVPFSHAHHVGGLGIDCRYCHTSVETSSNAGFPSTHTCMTCHSQIWTNASILEPVRRSFLEDRPIRWRKVYNIPGYVYFDHSIHVAKGVGCASCHGEIDRMPLTVKAHPFYMRQCIECHENPEKNLRPESEIYNLDWQPPQDPRDAERLGKDLVRHYRIRPAHDLIDCYVCHR